MRPLGWLAATGIGLVAPPAAAHDHWLEVTTTATGAVVRHLVGEGLVPELSRPWEPQKATRAELIGAERTDLLKAYPEPGTRTPALELGPLPAGTQILVLDRRPVEITLEGPKFREYLHEEGIDVSLQRRGTKVDFAVPGRERYARYLKAIVDGRDARAVGASRGQRLELTPLSAIPAAGGKLRVRVDFEGAPLPRAPVFAEHRDTRGLTQQRLETGKDGTVVVGLSRPGRWVVRLVHMRRCAEDCARVDWESAWGARTIDVVAFP